MRLPLHLAAPTLCLLVLPLCGPVCQAADDAGPAGKPLDTRFASSGPIHEAFVAPQPMSLEPPAVVAKAPPKPLREEMPDEKPEGDNVQWIPGYWDYDSAASDYVWVSGVWRMPPPGRQWAGGYWVSADGQWRRQPGFWAAFNEGGKTQELVYYPKPPEPKNEDVEEAPAGKVFAPGSWTHGPAGYTWSAGQYINAAPGWSWTAASYGWTPAGYTYTRGYWDYTIARRGLVYAPVYVSPTVRNVANYYYRPTRVIAPSTLANSLTLVGNARVYSLKNARFVGVKNVTGVKLVPVTAAERSRLQSVSQKLTQSVQYRAMLEAKGSASVATGPVRHSIDLPRPKAPATGANSRFQPPPRPAAGARTAPPPKKTAAPAAPAKNVPARKPAGPVPAAKKHPPKKPAPSAQPKKTPPKKNDGHKAGGKPQQKKK
jgi:hypothetical protein